MDPKVIKAEKQTVDGHFYHLHIITNGQHGKIRCQIKGFAGEGGLWPPSVTCEGVPLACPVWQHDAEGVLHCSLEEPAEAEINTLSRPPVTGDWKSLESDNPTVRALLESSGFSIMRVYSSLRRPVRTVIYRLAVQDRDRIFSTLVLDQPWSSDRVLVRPEETPEALLDRLVFHSVQLDDPDVALVARFAEEQLASLFESTSAAKNFC